jgi:hypothetical protein
MTLFETIVVTDCSTNKKTKFPLSAGTYPVDRVPCPLGHDCFWYVVAGTLTGASEEYFRMFETTDASRKEGVFFDFPKKETQWFKVVSKNKNFVGFMDEHLYERVLICRESAVVGTLYAYVDWKYEMSSNFSDIKAQFTTNDSDIIPYLVESLPEMHKEMSTEYLVSLLERNDFVNLTEK